MNIKNKKIILVAVGILILIVLGFVAKEFFAKKFDQQVSIGDPMDIVFDFYLPWLEAVKETGTDPYTKGMQKNPILSKELRVRIQDSQPKEENDLDPVLCQTIVPENIALRVVYELEDKVQMVITARGGEETNQAVVTLNRYNDGWYINEIECTPGEFGPEREFSFERRGGLLKDSIIEPFDPQYWHLVFEENNEQGHAVPLFFDSESMCLSKEGSTSVCDLSQLKEAMEVFVQGEMTERGVNVMKLEIIDY